jgi:hypothetical protein
MLSEWDITPGAYRPDPRVFAGFNTLTFNAKVSPATEPLVAKRWDRVRVRFVNLGAIDHHPIHIHGHSFWVVQTDGGVIPPSARWPETTVLVAVGQSRTIDFIADNPGDWACHCHMTHHTMNQMGHAFPNMVGADAARMKRAIKPLIRDFMAMGTTGMGEMSEMQTNMGHMRNMQMTMGKMSDHSEHLITGGMSDRSKPINMGGMSDHSEQMVTTENSIAMVGRVGPYGNIDMGGMFTILKVRENLASYADPGWYQPPAETVAQKASRQDLERDGI